MPSSDESKESVNNTRDSETELKQLLTEWAQAWSDGNFGKYASYYKPDFKPDLTTSHLSWLKVRKSRVKPGQGIQVSLSNIKAIAKGTADNLVTTTFKQTYSSKKFKDITNKTMVWEKIGGNWLIQEENSN
jgi:hypothetical protein